MSWKNREKIFEKVLDKFLLKFGENKCIYPRNLPKKYSKKTQVHLAAKQEVLLNDLVYIRKNINVGTFSFK